jgi:predicted transcriptional regulator
MKIEPIMFYILNSLPCEMTQFTEKIKGLSEEKQKQVMEKLNELIDNGIVQIKSNDKSEYVLTEKGLELVEKEKIRMRKQIKEGEEYELNPAGGFIKSLKFVYEPLSETEIVYNYNGEKGITTIKEAKGGLHYIELKHKRFYFKTDPLSSRELIFNLPDRLIVEEWVNGKYKAKDIGVIWEELKKYFKIFVDINDVFYDLCCLGVLESWVQDLLPSLFFLSIVGEFGGGKTTLLEALCYVAKHGYLVGNFSEAFIGRCYERLKITPGFDEFDSLAGEKDSPIYQIVRIAQRGGYYSRMTQIGKPETFWIRGVTFLTIHGDIEEALSQRCMPILTQESNKPELSRIQIFKKVYGQRLYNDLFIWYMENMPNLIDKCCSVDYVDIGEESISTLEDYRKILDSVALSFTGSHSSQQVNSFTLEWAKKLIGRNQEIAFSMALLKKILNLPEIDFLSIFKLREELLGERREIGLMGAFRDWIVNRYNQTLEECKKDKACWENYVHEGVIAISNKEMYSAFNTYLANIKASERLTPADFQGLLRDLGWTSGINRKKIRIFTLDEIAENAGNKPVRLANFFDERVCRRLGIEFKLLKEEEQKTLSQEKEINKTNPALEKEMEEVLEQESKKVPEKLKEKGSK